MTRLLLSLLLPLFLPLLLTAQAPYPATPVADARLYAVFDSVYLQNISRDNPALLLRWNFYLDNAFIISDFPAEKGDISQYPNVKIADLRDLNILLLEKEQPLARDWQKPVFYHIEGTNKVLMYFSGKDFNRKFREWLARKD
ncbi:MAG: hypothetical protein OHK0019_26440 [Saprospiraceae bacterium]